MTNLIATDVQGTTVDSGVVSLFEITLLHSGNTFYFCEGIGDDLEDIQMRDKEVPSNIRTYKAIPMTIEGVEVTSTGASARPTITIANVSSLLKDTIGVTDYDEVVGATVIRRQTLQKYLYGESGDASPPVEMPTLKYRVDRIAGESQLAIKFELAAVYDLEGVTIPRRVVVGKFCSWMYQGQALEQNGGCVWRADSVVRARSSTIPSSSPYNYNIFYNAKDQPLLTQTLLNGVSNWASGAAITQGSYRKYNNKWYRAQIGHTSSGSNDPEENDGTWVEALGYSTYSSSTTYAEGALVKADVTTVNSVVITTVWKSLHSGNINNAPALNSPHWIREEMCGKTLHSCKCRYGATLIGDNSSGVKIDARTDSSAVLPFGGFPGTLKF